MSSPNLLGEYLRARRELVRPADAGIRATGVRRTPGLRREEVATLAGISADYYLRLEQGRDRNPSVQVLDALARVLGLDTTARAYLGSLAGDAPRRASSPPPSAVPSGILMLIDTLPVPAFVESRRFDILAANSLATAMDPTIRPGGNRLRDIVLDQGARRLYPDWEDAVRNLVASFRTSIGTGIDDPDTSRLVGELSLASEEFRRWWARHDVKPLSGAVMRVHHPEVGPMELHREKLGIDGTDGQVLAIYHAERGSDSARSLALLGSLAAVPVQG